MRLQAGYCIHASLIDSVYFQTMCIGTCEDNV